MSKLKAFIKDLRDKFWGTEDGAGPEPALKGISPEVVSGKWAKWYSKKHNVSLTVAIQIGKNRLRRLKLNKVKGRH